MTLSRPRPVVAFLLLAAFFGSCCTFASIACAADEATASVGPSAGGNRSKRADVSKAVVSVSGLQPGRDATAAIVFKTKPGYHAQSHTPTADYLVAFEVKPEPNPAVTFGE